MVSALLNDALSDPASVILSLRDDQTARSPAQQFTSRVTQHFKAIFKGDDAFKQIPVLNAALPPECARIQSPPVVRFRAMVQDTSASPEVYPSLLRNGHPGGWGLAEAEETDDLLDIHNLEEREVVWAVSVPGESPFVADLLGDSDLPMSNVGLTTSQLLHKDPLMRTNHIGVQVKLYGSTSPPMKPTELHTFVGLLTIENLSSGYHDTHDGLEVLTLHTLFSVQHLPVLVPFKCFPAEHDTSSLPGPDQRDPAPSNIKDELIKWISDEALGGDSDAALWVILVTIARVQSRQPPLFPPSLTLSRFPRPGGEASIPSTPALVHVLRCLLPVFVDVPLTLPLINTRLFSPESRDESLHAGLLQLPAGSTIMFSDSGMQEGTVTETGVKNIEALRIALTMQTINYHFPFAPPYQFPTDLSFIVLTEGKKSAFIETLVNLPLVYNPSRDCFRQPEEIRMPPGDRLDVFRRLLGSAKVGHVKITDEMSQYIQEDFVQERQKDKSIGADDLMTRMSVARLLALLLQSPVLTKEVWQEAKELDQRRKMRV